MHTDTFPMVKESGWFQIQVSTKLKQYWNVYTTREYAIIKKRKHFLKSQLSILLWHCSFVGRNLEVSKQWYMPMVHANGTRHWNLNLSLEKTVENVTGGHFIEIQVFKWSSAKQGYSTASLWFGTLHVSRSADKHMDKKYRLLPKEALALSSFHLSGDGSLWKKNQETIALHWKKCHRHLDLFSKRAYSLASLWFYIRNY